MSDGLMSLVEENRKLHDRVRVLQAELAEQSVRLDKALEGAPYERTPTLDLKVSFTDHELLGADLLGKGRGQMLAERLAQQLVGRIQEVAYRVDGHLNLSRETTFHFRVARLGR